MELIVFMLVTKRVGHFALNTVQDMKPSTCIEFE